MCQCVFFTFHNRDVIKVGLLGNGMDNYILSTAFLCEDDEKRI